MFLPKHSDFDVKLSEESIFHGSKALKVGGGPMTPKRQLTDKVVSTWRLEPGKTYDVTFP